jgi:hypothetical protein
MVLVGAYAALRDQLHDAAAFPLILVFAQFLIVAGLAVGLRFLAINWGHVALAWPEPTERVRFWVRHSAALRLFAGLRDPLGFGRSVLLAVPTILLSIALLVALTWVHPALGIAGLYVVPIFPLAMLCAIGWPRSTSLALDATPLSGEEARRMAKGTLVFRMTAYAWICVAGWWPALTLILLPQLAPAADRLASLILIPALLLPWLMLVTSWISGLGALLYARLRESTLAATFD